MKNYRFLFLTLALFFLFSVGGVAQTNTVNVQPTVSEKIDSLSKPIIISDTKDKEVYETIKPNTLISTKEYELLLEEKKKKTQVKDPQ